VEENSDLYQTAEDLCLLEYTWNVISFVFAVLDLSALRCQQGTAEFFFLWQSSSALSGVTKIVFFNIQEINI